MGSYKKPAENKLISLLKARVESELWRATEDLDTALFEMKGDTQVAAVMEEYVATKLKDTASALGMRPIRRDPSRKEPVLCELTLMSTVEKRMGDLELQLNTDFTIHRIHRLWAKSQLSEEYPEKMKLILWRFFEPSIPLLKNPRATTDAELCRMALYHHINAALAYSNTVRGGYHRPLSEERDSQDIILRAQLDGERSAFYVVEGSHAANALLVMEKAVKERPDMPCRATWDSPEKRYYMELDREAVGGVFGLRMITDGSIDFYPLLKEPYENAAEKCLQQPQGNQPRNNLGVVSSDLLNIVVPWMHSQGLTTMQNNPDAGMIIRDLEPICQAALVTEDRIGNKIVLGETSLTLDQRKRRVAAVKPLVADKELRLDERLERVDLKADIGSLEGKKILNTCERRLLEYLMRGWKFVRSEDVKKAGGGDHHNLEMRVSEYLLAEYEDPKAWTQPVRDLPVYRLIQSTLAVKIMGSLMRMSNPTWSAVQYPETSTGAARAGDDEIFLLDSAALDAQACAVQVSQRDEAGSSSGSVPSMSFSLSPDFLIREIKGPNYEGPGRIRLRQHIMRTPLSIDGRRTLRNSSALFFCKRTLIDYLNVAVTTLTGQRVLERQSEPQVLNHFALDGAQVKDVEGMVFRVDGEDPVAEAVSALHDLAVASEQRCSLTSKGVATNEANEAYDIVIESTPQDEALVSLKPSMQTAVALRLPTSRGELTKPKFDLSTVFPPFTCPSRLADILMKAWMGSTSEAGVLSQRVLVKVEAEAREGKWENLAEGDYAVQGGDYPFQLHYDEVYRTACQRGAGEKTSTSRGATRSVRHRDPREKTFYLHRIVLPRKILETPEELEPIWERIKENLWQIPFPLSRMTLVDVCGRTLVDYLTARRRLDPEWQKDRHRTFENRLGEAVVESGSIKFKVPLTSDIGLSLMYLARITSKGKSGVFGDASRTGEMPRQT
ncbi:hypothetical protein FOZ60_016286 [Perkinsus olseni]|uniref:Uncharacterized protein n=1 Tax=Perkinsus olseni TaxID=32597 RepID=A0A7J6P4H5_PEROL|nr:hypothetical protein FOZ60_016286 [Perkinsus olseni]